MKATRSLALVLALAASTVHAQGRVWVVDDQIQPGVDFREVGAAVKAASDGDLVLVRTGNYSGFRIPNKEVSVVAARGAEVQIGGSIRVDSLGDGKDVLLRGLKSLEAGRLPLYVGNCAGTVWVEDCELERRKNQSNSLQEPSAAATVDDSAAVVFVRTRMDGGPGDDSSGFPSFTTEATHALRVSGSSVSLYDCDLVGGDGGDCSGDCFGGPGGDGASISGGSSFFASAGTLSGGRGGTGGYQYTSYFGTNLCLDGGEGGAGLRVGGLAPSIGYVRGASVSGGSGGAEYYYCSSAYAGDDGAPTDVSGGASLTTLADAPRSLNAQSPVVAGQAGRVGFEGLPGDLVMVSVSTRPGNAFDPSLGGTVIVGPVLDTKLLGVADASGKAGQFVAFDGPAGGADFARYFLQAVVADALGGTTVGGGSTVVVLAPGAATSAVAEPFGAATASIPK